MAIKSKAAAFFVSTLALVAVAGSAAASEFDDLFQQRFDAPEDVGVLGQFVSKAVEVGQYDQAISTLEQHLVKYPRDSRARLNLANIYSALGSWELAKRNAEIAVSIDDLSEEEAKQAQELAVRADRALSGFEWVLDMTVGIRSTWLDVEDPVNEWRDRQDFNPFAAVNTALKIDLDSPLNDSLIISGSGLVERRYEDINQGGFNPVTFDLVSGIHAHHRGRIAVTLDKGIPTVDLDAIRVQITAFGQFRTYNPSLVDIALGTTVRLIVQPTVDTSFYAQGTYANLEQSENFLSNHRVGVEAGASRRFEGGHTFGVAARYQREFTDGGTTINRQREIEVGYGGIIPAKPLGAYWTHQIAAAFGDFVSGDAVFANPFFFSPGEGTYWRVSWDHALQLDGHNRINFGYQVRENNYDLAPFAFFDPGSISHIVSLSFTKSF